MHVLKSIWAVFAGFLLVVFLSVITDLIMEKLGVFPAPGQGMKSWMLALALVYRCIYTILGGYVTARLAPNRIQRHVNILGIIGLAAGIAGIFVGWDMSEHWYPIALAVTAFPCVWLGGKWYTK